MLIVLYVWIGVSMVATLGIISAMALGSRRHIPAIDTDTAAEPMMILNRGVASGDSKLATSFAR